MKYSILSINKANALILHVRRASRIHVSQTYKQKGLITMNPGTWKVNV